MAFRTGDGDVRVALVVAIVLVASLPTAVAPASGLPPDGSPSSYAVAQGTTCQVVAPVDDTTQNVSAFYDYRNPYANITNPTASTYSSYGTTAYQQSEGSSLFFYRGANGTSLVTVHDRLGDESGGSTVTFGFAGLPAGGDWVVQDDQYPNRDDNWALSGTDATIDWVWGPNRTDGGAYRGFESFNDTLTITPGFNEDATRWGEWGYSDSEENRITAWTLYDASGETYELDRDRRVFVHRGGCNDTPPTATVRGPTSAARNETVSFDASASTDDAALGGFEWDFDGDGEVDEVTTTPTVEHAFETDGSYEVTVTAFDRYGNADSATVTTTVRSPNEPPNASLTAPETAYVNESVTLNATGSTDDAGVAGYEWDFDGDGTIDANTTAATVSHAYGDTGTYDATVTVSDENGSTDTATTRIEVSPRSAVDVSLDAPSAAETNESVTLTATAQHSSAVTVTGYRWDFDGDGTIDANTSSRQTQHQYGAAGEYEASVTAVTADGDTASASATVTVSAPNEPPVAALAAPENATTDTAVTLNASASTAATDITAYRWDFDGDGTIDTETETAVTGHIYEQVGTYTASVTVVDAAGATDTATRSITVENASVPPTAALSVPETAATNDSVTLNATGSTAATDITAYRWDFDGDGTIDTETTTPTVEHAYATAGEYAAAVTVLDEDGLRDTANATVTVTVTEPSLTAALTGPDAAQVNTTVRLDASESQPADDIARYEWDFDGDGTIDANTTTPTVTHTYSAPGEYAPRVVVRNATNQTDAAAIQLTIRDDEPPTASVSAPAAVLVNDSARFTAAESSDDDAITDYRWDFDGDGTIDANTTAAAVNHTYRTAGTYDATVTVVDTAGQQATATASVQAVENVTLAPSVTATPATTTPGEQVSLAAADVTPALVSSYSWSLGNGDTATGDTATATYDSPGTYTATLTVTGLDGEQATATTTVTVSAPDTGGSNDGGQSGNGGSGDSGGNSGGNAGGSDGSSGGGSSDGGGGDSGGQSSPPASGGQDGGGQSDDESPDAPEPTANLSAVNVSLSGSDLLVGETLVVRATVSNTGDAPGRTDVEFAIEGSVVETRTLVVPPNETVTATFTRTFDRPGEKTVQVDYGEKRYVSVTPRYPNISVTELSVESPVGVGEDMTFTAVVENTGRADGSKRVALVLFDEVVAVENTSVAAGEHATVTFTRSILSAGTYEATVGNASATVVVQSNGTTTSPTQESTGGTPGFGVGVALIALLVTLVMLVRRARRPE